MSGKTRKAEVEEAASEKTGYKAVVRDDTGMLHWLTGVNEPVGTKGTITYHSSPSYGRWSFTKGS